MIKLLSRLPLRALYGLASFLYLLAFYVVRHRRHVICEQIEKVFPKASRAERELIHRSYVKNFCDVMVEVLKSVSIRALLEQGSIQPDLFVGLTLPVVAGAVMFALRRARRKLHDAGLEGS